MKTHNVQQGTQEWLDLRASHFTASEAPAMMGVSTYQSRKDLLHEKATGIRKPVSNFLLKKFDEGHKAEEMARPIVEEMIDKELFPAVGTVDNLLASFDGITMDGMIIFEHKLWNSKLPQAIEDNNIPAMYLWQIAQQMLVSNASECIFVCSDGTKDNMKHAWIDDELLNLQLGHGWDQKLIDEWHKFADEIEAYIPPSEVEADQATDALLVQYKEALDEEKAAKEKAKALADQLKQIAESTGASKINAQHGFISLVERKGTVDYKAIPQLKGIDLEQYRKPPTQYFNIKTA